MNSRGYCFDQKKTLMQQGTVCLRTNITGIERSKNYKFLFKIHTPPLNKKLNTDKFRDTPVFCMSSTQHPHP